MKKNKKFQTLVFGLCCLGLFATGSVMGYAQTRSYDPSTAKFQTLTGRIRWNRSMGVVPKSAGSSESADDICAPFYIGLVVSSGTSEDVPPPYTTRLTRAQDDRDYYVCTYSIRVPANRTLVFMTGMGETSELPKPRKLPFYYTQPWIGQNGEKPAPQAGYARRLSQNGRILTIGAVKGTYLSIDMTYGPK